MAMETTREKRNILFCQFLFVFLRDHFRKRFSKFGTFQIIWSKNDQIRRIWWKNEINRISIHRIVWSTEIFDFSNYLVRWIIRLSESIDSPIFLMHRIRKTRKKYGYNISSVNGVAEFVKERLYPYNGTQQVLLNGIALECYDIEGQGSTDWSVHEKELYFPDSQEFWTFDLNIEIFPLKTGHRPLIRTGPWSPV